MARPTRHALQAERSGAGGPSDLMVLPLVLLVGCLVEFARSPSILIHPTLYAEDGNIWFRDAYTSGWLSPLAKAQVGYLDMFNRLVADVGLVVPLRAVPALFVGVALVVQVLPAVVVASKRFASVVPDVRIRLLLAAVYLLLPNSWEVNLELTNAMWHMAILSVLVVLAQPAGPAWRVFDVAVIGLAGLTGPFVLGLLVVISVLYVVRRERWTLVLGGVAATASALQVVTLLRSPRAPEVHLGATARTFVEIVGGRVVAGTVLGQRASMSTAFFTHELRWSTLALVVGLAIAGSAIWRGPLELKLLNLYGALTLLGSLSNPLSGPTRSAWGDLTLQPGMRYWYVPAVVLVFDIVWAACQVRTHRVLGVGGLVLLGLLLVVGVRGDFRYPPSTGPVWAAQVDRFDRLPPGSSFTFQIRPGWSFTVVKH